MDNEYYLSYSYSLLPYYWVILKRFCIPQPRCPIYCEWIKKETVMTFVGKCTMDVQWIKVYHAVLNLSIVEIYSVSHLPVIGHLKGIIAFDAGQSIK